jgi:LAO/AO transport system kinase
MNLKDLVKGLKKGDKRCLAKAITIIESKSKRDQQTAEELLDFVSQEKSKSSMRLGVSGVPGVGKSTFIHVLGQEILQKNPKSNLAIITIDPSSPKSGGSILGDRIRMDELSIDKRVFIRPCPSQEAGGGVAYASRDIVLLLEYCAYDVIIIESIGVGQGEYEICNLVDMFIFLQMPESGDVIQGIKKGILELADLIVVHKYDGVLKKSAQRSKQMLEMSLAKDSSDWSVPILCASSYERKGIEVVWDKVNKFFQIQKDSKNFIAKRKKQQVKALKKEILNRLETYLFSSDTKKIISSYEHKIVKENHSNRKAAQEIIKMIFNIECL